MISNRRWRKSEIHINFAFDFTLSTVIVDLA
jgi:hypothetical protein